MTELLYNTSAYIRSFEATVLSCDTAGGRYAVVLDKTAFFPEQGGQYADRGTLNSIAVCDVQIKDGIIYHYTEAPLAVGDAVAGEICFETRFDRMQNHTGEHLVCGVAHRLYGCENTGFHMGTFGITADLSILLNSEQVAEIEQIGRAHV